MAALTANIGELLGLNGRQPIVNNVRINDNLAERLEAERRRRLDAIDAEAKRLFAIDQKRKAAKARRNAITRRNELITELHSLVVFKTRKDGSRFMQAKPGQATHVKWLRNELETVSAQCRPANGYPTPPPRRSPLYPAGGTWKHRPMTVANVKGELNRLSTYIKNHKCETVADAEAIFSMLSHCQRLERKIQLLTHAKCKNCGDASNGNMFCSARCKQDASSQTNIRRQQGTKYYRAVVDAR